MFGFGWVRTHLGDFFFFFGEYTSFLLILVGFLEKWTKSTNLGNFEVLRHGVERKSTSRRGREGGLDKPRVHRGVAKLRHNEGLRLNVAVLRRGVALFTDMCFCYVLLFRYFEDLSLLD